MDLVYTDEKRRDIGVLKDYALDLAYGADENNFECEIYIGNHVCEKGYMLYMENTEYGGIIDGVRVNTENQTLVYIGRTWHGVLNGKVLEPDAGNDYLVLSGEANQVLAFVIERIGLGDLFTVSTKDSGIMIENYRIRYDTAYLAVCDMLSEYNGKLQILFKEGQVKISAVFLMDYSIDEEWDSSQMHFKIEKNYRPVNHLVCLGSGDLKDRYVIHLFTDENGGIQPYAKAEIPVKDSDYVFDKSGQIMLGTDEVTEIYDYPNAQTTENYIRLMVKPDDWENTYEQYYCQENKEFKAAAGHKEDVYRQQVIAPYDWNVNYTDYYVVDTSESSGYKNVSKYSEEVYILTQERPFTWLSEYGDYYYWAVGDRKYHSVEGVNYTEYQLTNFEPTDWPINFADYYYYYSDGITSEYKKVSGDTKYKYSVQTQKPTDWSSNYKSYYTRKAVYRYRYYVYQRTDEGVTEKKEIISDKADMAYDENGNKVELVEKFVSKYIYEKINEKKAPTWKAKKYYTQISYNVAPKWENSKYYWERSGKQAPEWKPDTYFYKTIKNVPDWETGKYYTKTNELVSPEWVSGRYFEKNLDHFAVLVEGGIKKLKESYDCDEISAEFEPDKKYDIGDIVGAVEEVTGVTVWQPITKKIVRIQKGIETIEYKIGE